MAHQPMPIIGIVCMDDQPRHDEHRARFGQNQTYVHAVARAGGAPLLLPLLADHALLRVLYDQLDGLLFPGGDDIDPDVYGEPVHEKCGSISPLRDDVELTLLRWAAAEAKPLLAICRGIQVLNVALGGSLYQDIGAQLPAARRHDYYPGYPRDYTAHEVSIAPHSDLARLIGAEPLPVNSLHHQALKDLAPGVAVSGRAPDGVVEAVEVPGHPFALGVQWHPEELADRDERAQNLFDALVAHAAKGDGGLRHKTVADLQGIR